MKITMIIPTLNPSKRILDVIEGAVHAGVNSIIVVNDGSEETCQPIFEKIQSIPECILLIHDKNYGKGQALKTAMKYYTENISGNMGVVTCDDDGQHYTEDIVLCAKEVIENSKQLVLGVRAFESSNIPLKSKIGNQITRWFVKVFCNTSITDTQTGLRGIPNCLIPIMLQVNGQRFEYETNMLLETRRHNIQISEVQINTVYLDNNRATRFRPLRDSIDIFYELFKFTFVSIFSFLLDIVAFATICNLLKGYGSTTMIFYATVLSRSISSMFNYLMNRKFAFQDNAPIHRSVIKYYTLCIAQGMLSFLLVAVVTYIMPKVTIVGIKVLVDVVLFFGSFHIQKIWVFKNKKDGLLSHKESLCCTENITKNTTDIK